jgi:hypothetical protein
MLSPEEFLDLVGVANLIPRPPHPRLLAFLRADLVERWHWLTEGSCSMPSRSAR